MTSDLALATFMALSGASEDGSAPAEAVEECPVVEAENAEDAESSSALGPRPVELAPRLSPRSLEFEPPQRPSLLAPDAESAEAECPDRALDWLTTPARVWTPPPSAPGSGWDAPRIWSEVGVRTTARVGVMRVYADGVARLDVQSATERAEPVRTRLTARQRAGLEAAPHDQVHLGLEFSRRSNHGVDPLPAEARATANLRLRFGF